MFNALETANKPIDLGTILSQHLRAFQHYPAIVRHLLTWWLKKFVGEERINRFLQDNDHLKDFDFIDQIFDELKIDYLVHHNEISNIPVTGKVLIIANHPLGGLDGLALLHLIGRSRRDVFIVVNELLLNIKEDQEQHLM